VRFLHLRFFCSCALGQFSSCKALRQTSKGLLAFDVTCSTIRFRVTDFVSMRYLNRKSYKIYTTLDNGSLGSRIDEERSELR
jgi:hypothetical protein